MPEWTAIVRDIGFPIFVAVYLLTRFDRMLSHISENSDQEIVLLKEIRNRQS